jgi:hypothetical protein
MVLLKDGPLPARQRGLHAVQFAPELLKVARRETRRGESDGQALEGFANQEFLVHLGCRKRWDHSPASGIELYQALSFQFAQRLAQRRAADAELLGQAIFENSLAGRERAVQDQLAQPPVRHFAHRRMGRQSLDARLPLASNPHPVCIMLYTTEPLGAEPHFTLRKSTGIEFAGR